MLNSPAADSLRSGRDPHRRAELRVRTIGCSPGGSRRDLDRRLQARTPWRAGRANSGQPPPAVGRRRTLCDRTRIARYGWPAGIHPGRPSRNRGSGPRLRTARRPVLNNTERQGEHHAVRQPTTAPERRSGRQARLRRLRGAGWRAGRGLPGPLAGWTGSASVQAAWADGWAAAGPALPRSCPACPPTDQAATHCPLRPRSSLHSHGVAPVSRRT